jgi:hypothetical protein
LRDGETAVDADSDEVTVVFNPVLEHGGELRVGRPLLAVDPDVLAVIDADRARLWRSDRRCELGPTRHADVALGRCRSGVMVELCAHDRQRTRSAGFAEGPIEL